MPPIIKPFGQIVVNILVHTSVKWFYNRSWETRDIFTSVPAFLLSCSSASAFGTHVPVVLPIQCSLPLTTRVNFVLAHASAKFHDHRAQYERVINFLVHDISAVLQQSSAGWHAYYRCSIIPVTVSFDHNVSYILAHIFEKFHDHRIQDKREMFLSCACCPRSPAAEFLLIGECVAKNPLLRLSNPITHLCIINLHMPLQVGLSIGSTIVVI